MVPFDFGRLRQVWDVPCVFGRFLPSSDVSSQRGDLSLIRFYSLFLLIITGVIEWPGEDEAPPEDARDLVTKLLEQDPIVRLGTAGKWSWGRFYVP